MRLFLRREFYVALTFIGELSLLQFLASFVFLELPLLTLLSTAPPLFLSLSLFFARINALQIAYRFHVIPNILNPHAQHKIYVHYSFLSAFFVCAFLFFFILPRLSPPLSPICIKIPFTGASVQIWCYRRSIHRFSLHNPLCLLNESVKRWLYRANFLHFCFASLKSAFFVGHHD